MRQTYVYIPGKTASTVVDDDRVQPIDDSVPPTKHPELTKEAKSLKRGIGQFPSERFGATYNVLAIAYAHEAKNSKEKVVFTTKGPEDQEILKCVSVKKFRQWLEV